jgi:DNA-binding NarL/FixJ family response regulator
VHDGTGSKMHPMAHGRVERARGQSHGDHRRDSRLVRTRIAFVDMPRMLREIVDEAFSKRRDVHMVDETRDGGGLVGAVDRSEAALVIVSSEAVGPAEVCRLLADRPRVRVFAIADGGRDGCLYEQRPNLMLVDELSPSSLVQAVLDNVHSEANGTKRNGR